MEADLSLHGQVLVIDEAYTLQRFTFPTTGLCSNAELYFHASQLASFEFSAHRLLLSRHGEVIFDTYFNSFSSTKWAKHTALDSLGFEIECEGEFVFRVEENNVHRASKVLGEYSVRSDALARHRFDIPFSGAYGTLFVRATCLSERGLITGGSFTTRTLPVRRVRVGIVITTFNRREYLAANLERIRNAVAEDPTLAAALHVVVVDNASNLGLASDEHLTYLPNPNLGGAGGFSRGLDYLRTRGGFTHALFMDDDISFEVEAIRRAATFVAYARDPQTCVAGAMFIESEPHVQFEAGAAFLFDRVMPQLQVFGAGLDMRRWDMVMLNDAWDHPVGYGAWWFFLFPVDISGRQLAFPFFLRGDDILFSSLYARRIVTLNGVNVWHSPFEYKDSPTTVYYNQRNWEIVRAIAGPSELSVKPALGYFLRTALHENFALRYGMVEYRVRAIRDFLKGPEFWRGLDHAGLNQELRAGDREMARPLDFDGRVEGKPYEYRVSRLRNLLQALTLNGHLLPGFLFRRWQARPLRAFWLQERKLSGVFGQQRVLYWYPPTNEGFLVEHSKRRFFRNLAATLTTALALLFDYQRVRARYRAAYQEMSSPEYWAMLFGTGSGKAADASGTSPGTLGIAPHEDRAQAGAD